MSKGKNKDFLTQSNLYSLTDEEKAQLASIETIEFDKKSQKVLNKFSLIAVRIIKGIFIILIITVLFLLSNRSHHEDTNKTEIEALKHEQEQMKKLKQLIDDEYEKRKKESR